MHEIYEPAEDSYLLANVLKKNFSAKDNELKFLEIGCGSGIQIKTLLEIGIKKENISCCDINPLAVEKCKEICVDCFVSNLFENVKDEFNVIIFNPPYLPVDENEPEESRLATSGGKKGSELVNKFLKSAKRYLRENGMIFLLTSSLTQDVDFGGYEMEILAKKKLFFEELFVWKLKEKVK
jgi:release factor glutamine methyltransferase